MSRKTLELCYFNQQFKYSKALCYGQGVDCMPIKKDKAKGNYVCVSQSVLRDKSLSLDERGLLITLLSLPESWNFSVRGLQEIIPDGREKITGALNRLIEFGYVSKEQDRREHGKFSSNTITVHEIPNSPCTGFPLTAKPSTAKPVTGNPTQYNNKEYKNKQYNNQTIINSVNRFDSNRVKKKNMLNDFPETTYDFDEIERIKLGNSASL